MRIIGGFLKGRRINPPANNWPTRPTMDYAKEALFNILNNRLDFDETRVLDLFGGTGNHSFEFISRGSQDVTYVDKFAPCVQFVIKTAQEWKIEDRIHVQKSDVFKFLEWTKEQYDFIFADPPYAMPKLELIPDLVFNNELLEAGGLLVMEHNPHHDFKEHKRFVEARVYGKTVFSFFE